MTYDVAILALNLNVLEPPIQMWLPPRSELICVSQSVAAWGSHIMLQIVTFWADLFNFRHICENLPLRKASWVSANLAASRTFPNHYVMRLSSHYPVLGAVIKKASSLYSAPVLLNEQLEVYLGLCCDIRTS